MERFREELRLNNNRFSVSYLVQLLPAKGCSNLIHFTKKS